jgi:hypothetical protein
MENDPTVLAAIELRGPRAGALGPDSFEEFWTQAGRLVARAARVNP